MKTISLAIMLAIVACGSKPDAPVPSETPASTVALDYYDMSGYWAAHVEITKENSDGDSSQSQHTMFIPIPYTGPSADVLDTGFLAVVDKLIVDHLYERPTVGQNYGWLNRDRYTLIGYLNADGGQIIVRLDQVEDQTVVKWLQDTWKFSEMELFENPFEDDAGIMSSGPQGFVIGMAKRLKDLSK